MDFFQKLSNTGKDLAKKTKDMSDISRLNHEITKQQEQINRTYSEIGKLYFESYAELDYSELKELCNSIKEANKKIEEFKTEIIQIKGITYCPNCNAEVSTSATFCSSCGYKLKEITDTVENSTEQASSESTETVKNNSNSTFFGNNQSNEKIVTQLFYEDNKSDENK